MAFFSCVFFFHAVSGGWVEYAVAPHAGGDCTTLAIVDSTVCRVSGEKFGKSSNRGNTEVQSGGSDIDDCVDGVATDTAGDTVDDVAGDAVPVVLAPTSTGLLVHRAYILRSSWDTS